MSPTPAVTASVQAELDAAEALLKQSEAEQRRDEMLARLREAEGERDEAIVRQNRAIKDKENMTASLHEAKAALARAQVDFQELMDEIRAREETRKCCYALRG